MQQGSPLAYLLLLSLLSTHIVVVVVRIDWLIVVVVCSDLLLFFVGVPYALLTKRRMLTPGVAQSQSTGLGDLL